MKNDLRFLIPFDSDELDDGWRLFFPFREVHHMGITKDFTAEDGEEMVMNFRRPVPDYKLPVNERHDDSVGIYGFVSDLRISERGVEWLPEFREGAVDTLRDKGYLYASPEVWFNGYEDVSGKYYNNVALGMAITPRPRLGAATLVFEDGNWVEQDNSEESMSEVNNALSEDNVEQMKQIAEDAVKLNLGSWFMDLFKREPASEEDEDEPGDSSEDTDNAQEFADQLQTKDAEITALQEALSEKDGELTVYNEAQAKAERELRMLQFSEKASKIEGLPEEATDFAEVLLWLEDNDESEEKVYFNRIVSVLETLGNREKMASLFGEIGHEGHEAESGDSKIEKLVKEKEANGMSRGDAVVAVFSEHPDLYAEYDTEHVKNISSIDIVGEV